MKKLYAKDVGYEKVGSFKAHNPFEIAFVYPRNDRAYVLKGGHKEIDKAIEQERGE